ncbi:hypothetical protein CDL15_Pgr028013 [Punica granatum]|uniref:Uncharacterized protein n=1 Tax=Punica granatum TaxID=22663 RepID=A0A218XKJ9_PUNGR|nr:hypothetical protein CDL15_Pgr028013 [Punica granatum]PKI45324.1 hypothetical protein CRG98_034285 [Punica granatum]
MESKSNNKCFTSKRPLTRFLPEPYSKRCRVEQGVDWCQDIYDIAYIDGVLCFVLDVQPLAVVFEKEHPVLYTNPAGTTFLNPPSCETTDNCQGMNWNECAKDNCPTDHTLEPSIGSIKSRKLSDGLSKTVDHQEILDQTDNSIEVDQTICSDVEYSIEEYDEDDGDGGASKDLGACFLQRRFDVIRDFPKGCGPRAEDNCPTNNSFKPSSGSNKSCTRSAGFSKTVDHREILDQADNSIEADQSICSDDEYSIGRW